MMWDSLFFSIFRAMRVEMLRNGDSLSFVMCVLRICRFMAF